MTVTSLRTLRLAHFADASSATHKVLDTSRKVKNSLHAKFLAGERTFAYAPLGYKQDPDVKNRLVIDEETRWIVEKIFDLAFHGAGAAKITGILLDEQVPTPGWLNYTRYGTFANIYADAPEKKRYAWTVVYDGEVPVFEKYDDYVPPELIRRAFAYGVLDIEGMRKHMLGE